MRFSELPQSLRHFILLQALCLGPVVWVLSQLPGITNWPLVGYLVLFTTLFALWRVELTVLQGRMTLVFAVVCVAQLLQGAQAATLCAALGGLVSTLVNREDGSWKLRWLNPRLYRMIFNVANAAAAAALSSALYILVIPRVPAADLGTIVALTAFTGSYFFLNTAGVALACALQQRLSWRAVWQDNFLWTAPGFFASASAAVGIERAFNSLGPLALLFLPPMWLVYRSYRLYMDRIRQNTHHIEELNRLNQAIISSLATAIDAKDRYTCSHINRVQHYALALAKAASLSGPELDAVSTGALVHDIGKLGIPDHILGKPGKLTTEEFKRIQTHVTIGADILSPIPFPFPVVDVVLTHHERWDGLGYPRGLKGEEIPIGGRIISLVDVFDALTSNRPYRKAMTHEEALAELRANAGRQFDPRLVELFSEIQPRCARELAEMEAAAQKAEESAAPTDGSSAFSRISQAAAEMAAVSDVAHSLAEHETQEQICQTVVARTLALLPGDTAVLYLRNQDDLVLEAAAVDGKYRHKLEQMTIQMGEGVAGWVAANQQPRVNVSASLDIARRFTPEEQIELNAATAVPLVHGPESVGVLAVYTQGYSVLSEHHLRVLNIVAEHAAAALQNVRRMEHHRELAHTDPLTGLVNSRGLVRHLDQLMFTHNRAGGQKSEFSIVMLDVDRFKEVNDTLGHLRGDEMLREIGALICGVSRANDIPCRYAGDEFVLLLPGTQREQAEEVAGRLRNAVDTIPLVEGKVKIGASVGVATFPADGEHGRELIHVADRRMYEDKFHRRRSASLLGGEKDEAVAGSR